VGCWAGDVGKRGGAKGGVAAKGGEDEADADSADVVVDVEVVGEVAVGGVVDGGVVPRVGGGPAAPWLAGLLALPPNLVAVAVAVGKFVAV
jgi:hypothetical protein